MEQIELLHCITEPTRFRLLALLARRDYCVRALARKLGVTESAVSQHMQALKKYRVVEGTRVDYHIHYRIDSARIREAVDALSEALTGAAPEHAGINCTCDVSELCRCRNAAAGKGGVRGGK